MAERRNKVTMADIARESGLSLSTVSLVLNEKPGLPQETRQKVLSVARDLGYEMRATPPAVNRHSALHTIGMLVKRSAGDQAPPSSNIFFSHVMAGIEAGCRQENIALLYSTLLVDEYNHCIEVPRLIEDSRVNGFIIVGSFVDETLNTALRARGVPVILVDAYCCEGEYDSVLIENYEGAYQAIQYLINQGHRNIAFVGSTPDTRLSFRYRREGYSQALKDNGIAACFFGDCLHNDREAIIDTTRRLLIENPQVSAIFGCNDEVAIIALHGALDAGRRVPQDLSVVGFDNNTNAVNTLPPLTTMHVDKVGMGLLAVQLMVNRVENPDLGIVTLYVHTKLIERQSVKELC